MCGNECKERALGENSMGLQIWLAITGLKAYNKPMTRTVKITLGLTLLLAPLAGRGNASEWKWLTGGNLKAVKFVGQQGWIIGDDGNQGIILHTTNGGDTWVIQPHNTGRHYFNGLSVVDSANAWIAGGRWSLGEPGFILRTRDGGRTWSEEFNTTAYNLRGIFFLDTTLGWYTANIDTIFSTTDGGRTWRRGVTAYNNNADIFFVNPLKGWTVRGNEGGIFTISSSTDGGLSWSAREDMAISCTGSLTMSDSVKGWAAGFPGWVVRTTNGWQTWARYSTGGGGELYDISFRDSLSGQTVGGDNGTNAKIYKTSNGGLAWAVDSIVYDNAFYGVDAGQLPTAWVVGSGGSLLKTTTSGNTWMVYRNVDIGTRSLNNAFFKDVNQGWAVGTYGAITHTANGGTVWQLQNSGTQSFLYGVDFPNPQRGWVCGDGWEILTTSDAGNNWVYQTSNATSPLYSIDFVDTLYGVAVGGYYGPLDSLKGHGSTGGWEHGRKRTEEQILPLNQVQGQNDRWSGFTQDDTIRPWGTGLDFWKYPWRPEETALTTAYRTITRTTNGGALWIAQNTSGQVPLYGVSFVDPAP
jgi:photosystem II stability/assembly factor-like uncharacterized protein